MKCPKCRGSKIITNSQGKLEPCACFSLSSLVGELATEADLAYFFERAKLFDSRNVSQQLLSKLMAPNPPLLLVTGANSFTRTKVVQLCLLACSLAQRKIVKLVLNDYIQAQFEKDAAAKAEQAKSADVVWFSLDFYRAHAWAEKMLEEICCARASVKTVITADQGGFASVVNFGIPMESISLEGLRWITK